MIKKKANIRKRKILPPHSWEVHPSSHLAGVRKPFIIAGITIVLLILISVFLLFQEQIVGKAFQLATVNTAGIESGLKIAANQPNTIIPVKANIGSAQTTAIRFVMNLPAGVQCADVWLVSALGWPPRSTAATPLAAGAETNPSASYTTIANCADNRLTLEQSTLDGVQTKTGVFTIADLTFPRGLPVGGYEFTAAEFTIVNSQSPTFEILSIPLGLVKVSVVQCLTATHCSGATPVCNLASNTCIARPTACGDGIVQAGETCDDGNTGSGDGCNDLCQNENVCPPDGGRPTNSEWCEPEQQRSVGLAAPGQITLVGQCSTPRVACETRCSIGFHVEGAGATARCVADCTVTPNSCTTSLNTVCNPTTGICESTASFCAIPAPANAAVCVNRAAPTAANTANVLLATCPASNVPACSFSCPPNFHRNNVNTACVSNSCVSTGETEAICNDGIDNNCNGFVDCDDPNCNSLACVRDGTVGRCNLATTPRCQIFTCTVGAACTDNNECTAADVCGADGRACIGQAAADGTLCAGGTCTGGTCVSSSAFQCAGSVPDDAALCAGDGTSLTVSVANSVVSACTDARKCEYTCATGFRLNAGGTACESVSGGSCATPRPAGAAVCANRAAPTAANTANVLLATCPASNVPACSFSCSPNFQLNSAGTACVSSSAFQCTGSAPAYAALCAGDGTSLTASVANSIVSACTDARKCEYTCRTNYVLRNGLCVLSTCGNDRLEDDEECDLSFTADPFGGTVCTDGDWALGKLYLGGTLRCTSQCTLDESQCRQCNSAVNCLANQQCTAQGRCVSLQAQETPPSGGGGGGGGTRCVSSWNCGAWSYCNNQLRQTRTCADLRNCVRQPRVETQACIQCDESWVCSSWSACSGGSQTRTCTDEHVCGTARTKPITQQSCPMPSSGYTPPPYAPPPVIPEPTFWEKYKIPLYIAGIVAGGGLLALLLWLLFRTKKKAYNIGDLSNWIGAELRMGTSTEDVKQILREQTGWTGKEVEQAFRMSQGDQTLERAI